MPPYYLPPLFASIFRLAYIMSRKTLSDNEMRLLLSNNDDLGEESDEELIPCNDSEVEDNVLHDNSDTSASSDADSETKENDIQEDYITSTDGTECAAAGDNE